MIIKGGGVIDPSLGLDPPATCHRGRPHRGEVEANITADAHGHVVRAASSSSRDWSTSMSTLRAARLAQRSP